MGRVLVKEKLYRPLLQRYVLIEYLNKKIIYFINCPRCIKHEGILSAVAKIVGIFFRGY